MSSATSSTGARGVARTRAPRARAVGRSGRVGVLAVVRPEDTATIRPLAGRRRRWRRRRSGGRPRRRRRRRRRGTCRRSRARRRRSAAAPARARPDQRHPGSASRRAGRRDASALLEVDRDQRARRSAGELAPPRRARRSRPRRRRDQEQARRPRRPTRPVAGEVLAGRPVRGCAVPIDRGEGGAPGAASVIRLRPSAGRLRAALARPDLRARHPPSEFDSQEKSSRNRSPSSLSGSRTAILPSISMFAPRRRRPRRTRSSWPARPRAPARRACPGVGRRAVGDQEDPGSVVGDAVGP